MKYSRTAFSALILIVASFSFPSGWAGEPTSKHSSDITAYSSWQEVVNYARDHLPQEGQLLVTSNGYGYLKVDDDYIHALFPLLGLEEEGFKEPPYFRRANAPGAHISIFYEDENVFPQEFGQTFHFELKGIVIVRPSKEVSYAVLQIEAPELEKLRKKYGLSPKLHGHEYHISLAKKTK